VETGLAARLRRLRTRVTELSAAEVWQQLRDGAVLIDIREEDEVAAGMPVPAQRVARGMLELQIERHAPSLDTPVTLMCAGGTRSLLAADAVQALGYRRVASMAGGFAAWKAQGLPVHVPRLLGSEEKLRYARHLRIPEVGEAGQLRLLRSRVLLIGAGGLGSPAAYYLAAAGVGALGLVDDDVVDRSNLQRQILHADARVGMKKVESARQTLSALNPTLRLHCHDLRLNAANAEALLADYDLVIDGSDNFSTRYLINDTCVKLGIANVHGAIFRFEGYVTVYSKRHHGPCYRCSFPTAPPPDLAPSCAEAGVLGVLPGVIGTLQAVEAIKLLLGIGKPLVGRVLSYDALQAEFTEHHSDVDPECPVCTGRPEDIRLADDEPALCATPGFQ
jgi:molybdopterin/thiamine biosynthesis adenylyltransferase/rhodanese-related sulfurtransferase